MFFPLHNENHFEKLNDSQLKYVVNLLVKYTRKHDNTIDSWVFDVNSHTLQDVINRCLYSLYNYVDINEVSVVNIDDELHLRCNSPIYFEDKLYVIPLLNVFNIKESYPLLFDVLMSFILKLPFNNMFKLQGYSEWIFEWLKDDLNCKLDCKEEFNPNEEFDSLFISNSIIDNIKAYESSNWSEKLNKFIPKNKLHIEIKRLLLESKSIDFHCVFNTAADFDSQYDFDLSQLYIIGDKTESSFAHYMINYLNDLSNAYGSLTANNVALISENKINDFCESLNFNINRTNTFLIKLIELLNKL